MLIRLQEIVDDRLCYEKVRELRWQEGVSCIRLRANFWINYSYKPPVRLFWLFNDLPFNSARQIQKPVLLTNQLVYLSGMRIINNKNQIELLSVATYYFDPCALKVMLRPKFRTGP